MDNTSFKLLKLYSIRESLSLADLAAIYNSSPMHFAAPVKYLMNHDLLRIDSTYATVHGADFTMHAPIQITQEGLIALEAARKERRNFKYSEFRAWITLAIALAAFIKSFFF